jgi:phosphatidylinositol glycan class T
MHAHHRAVMSKPFASIVTNGSFDALELWFGRGRWNARRLGTSPVVVKPTGAEAWASWRNASTSAASDDVGDAVDVESEWKEATTVLGGVFCASLSALSGSTSVTEPALAFQEWDGGERARRARGHMVVKHASLPHEAVCVENLAPWLKQLPCRDRAGLGRALKTAHDVFGSSHLTFGFRLSREGEIVRAKQTLMMVIPKDVAHENILALISDSRENECVVADHSYAHVRRGENLQTFDLGKELPRFDVITSPEKRRTPSVFVERYLTGNGNENGGIVIDVERAMTTNSSGPIRVRLFQPLPWFVKLFMHTLVIEVDGETVSRDSTEGIKFTPPIDRVRSSVLELQTVLPSSASTLRIRMDYDKGFLQQDEFPADANRGFDLPPARLDSYEIRRRVSEQRSILKTPLTERLATATSLPETVYMSSLIILLPTPDFSMTFNVSALTGSLLSIIAITLIKTLTTRPAWEEYTNRKSAGKPKFVKIATLLAKLRKNR